MRLKTPPACHTIVRVMQGACNHLFISGCYRTRAGSLHQLHTSHVFYNVHMNMFAMNELYMKITTGVCFHLRVFCSRFRLVFANSEEFCQSVYWWKYQWQTSAFLKHHTTTNHLQSRDFKSPWAWVILLGCSHVLLSYFCLCSAYKRWKKLQCDYCFYEL